MTQSSYLISFIRNLMEHSSKDVREKKRRQLEAEFTQTGLALNTCLSEQFEDVTKVLNVYNSVSERISINLTSLARMKTDLIECKTLLYCNRDELRRLWLELVEQRHCIELLDMLDRLQSAPDAITTLIGVRAWPEATDLTLYAAELLRSEIAVVPALNVIKADLALKHKNIIDHLKKQLYSLIYDRSLTLALRNLSKGKKNPTAIESMKGNIQQDGNAGLGNSVQVSSQSRFSALPLSSWSSCAVSFPVVNPNLRKDPLAVAQSIAATVAPQSHPDSTSTTQEKTKHDLVKSDADWIRELVAVVHCLARLERLPQILACWSPQSSSLSRMQQSADPASRNAFSGPLIPGQGLLGELHRHIVTNAVNAVEARAISQGITQPLAGLSDPRFLVMLLQLVFDAFFMQARACMLVIRAMKEAQAFVLSSFRDLEGLTGHYIWSCVQHEIQLLLSIHLNKRSSDDGVKIIESSGKSVGSVDVRNLGLNNLLGRKRTGVALFTGNPTTGSQTSKADPLPSSLISGALTVPDLKRNTGELFSFANTSHFQSISSYIREHRALTDPDALVTQSAGESLYTNVCLPRLSNILVVYKPVVQFIEALEREMAASGTNSPSTEDPVKRIPQLRLYLKNFIENTYLPETLNSLRMKLQQSLSAPDFLNAIVSQQIERELGLVRPILSIVFILNECLNELKRVFLALPEFTAGCLKIATSLLNEFVGAGWRIYRGLSEVDSSGTTAPSSDWAQDDDVSRFWKKFPVWQRMAAHEAHMIATNLLIDTRKHPIVSSLADESSAGTVGDKSNADRSTTLENHVKSTTAVALGLYTHFDRNSASSSDSPLNAQLLIPFADSQRIGSLPSGSADERNVNYSRLSSLHCERETTRLAAKETRQLMDMIKNELPDDPAQTKGAVRQLPALQNVQLFKILGRLSESFCWLSYRVLNLNKWVNNLRQQPNNPTSATSKQSVGRSNQAIMDTPLSSCSQEITRLSEACLLMIYLEVRIQAYNHFGGLPSGVTYWCPLDDVDVDRYVTDFLIYLEQIQDMLMRTINRHKFRFIFDGLGDFIAQLLLRLIPLIPRMNANGNRKMCRNVYRLQQALTSLTDSRESDLIRVKQLFEMFALTPDTVIDRLLEEGVAFDESVYQDLMRLYQRSHPTYPFAKTEECIVKLRTVVSRPSL